MRPKVGFDTTPSLQKIFALHYTPRKRVSDNPLVLKFIKENKNTWLST